MSLEQSRNLTPEERGWVSHSTALRILAAEGIDEKAAEALLYKAKSAWKADSVLTGTVHNNVAVTCPANTTETWYTIIIT